MGLGTVKLHIIQAKDGSVRQIELVSGDPQLVQAANMAKQWKLTSKLTSFFLEGINDIRKGGKSGGQLCPDDACLAATWVLVSNWVGLVGSFLPSLGRNATKVHSGRGADILIKSSWFRYEVQGSRDADKGIHEPQSANQAAFVPPALLERRVNHIQSGVRFR